MYKKTIYIVLSVLLLTFIVAGSTYAFFNASIKSNNEVTANSADYQIIYTGGTAINGPINVSTNRNGGLNTTVNIKKSNDSVPITVDLNLNIATMSEQLSVEGFIWEVVGIKNNNQVYYSKGNFSQYNATTNNIVSLVEDYQLTEENTAFTVYFWIDGNQVDNNVYNTQFSATISAKSDNFTGKIG